MKYFLLLFILIYSLLHAKVIAKIPEASGICYLADSHELIVVNDEGTIYRLTPTGKILQEKYLGDYDFEGVARYKSTLLLAVEDKHAIFILDSQTFKILKKVKIKKHKDIKRTKKHGFEAIAVKNGVVYLSVQNSHIFTINTLHKEKAKVKEIYKHGYQDISGMTFYHGFLYMLSDKKNLLIKYDLKSNKTLLKIELAKVSQEGLSFDSFGNLYIANDAGNILRYTKKELGL